LVKPKIVTCYGLAWSHVSILQGHELYESRDSGCVMSSETTSPPTTDDVELHKLKVKRGEFMCLEPSLTTRCWNTKEINDMKASSEKVLKP